jgi:hypothetical protein
MTPFAYIENTGGASSSGLRRTDESVDEAGKVPDWRIARQFPEDDVFGKHERF